MANNKKSGLGLRTKKPKIFKDTRLVVPFLNINEKYIEVRDGVMDIMQIKTRDLYAMGDEDLEYLFAVETKFLRSFRDSYKEITLNFPTNCDSQRRYWENVRRRTTSPIQLEYVDRKLYEFDFLESNRKNREYFIFIYADNPESLETKKQALIRARADSFPVFEITQQKKKDILFLMNNQNSKIIRKD